MKRSWIIGAVVLMLVLVGGAIAYYLFHTSASPTHVPENIRARVSFPLYIPKKLPDGMGIDEKSFSATDQVVAYQVTYDNSKKLYVSIQARNESIDPDNYPGDESFSSSIGKAVIIDRPDRTTAAVFAEKSWALINAPQKISSEQLHAFINSLSRE